MYTANSMNCLAEALGVALPGNGTIPAPTARRIRLAKTAGMRIMELVREDVKIRDIATMDAFRNAIAVDMALGCSTNTVLHVPAIANDAGILGQVVRIYDHSAEVSLLEDRDFAVPVQVARNGLRAAVFGAGRGNPLELRYLPVASDLEVGDVLITSGIDGVYPPGFAVAVISRIERNADQNSSNVFCVPVSPVNRYRQALAFLYDPLWDAKASAITNKSVVPTTNAPGRRQTRARGVQ